MKPEARSIAPALEGSGALLVDTLRGSVSCQPLLSVLRIMGASGFLHSWVAEEEWGCREGAVCTYADPEWMVRFE